MAHITADRIQERSWSTGTGAVTLGGASDNSFLPFSSRLANGDTCHYLIVAAYNGVTTGQWELGLGTYNSVGNSLTRTAVYASSNSDLAVTFASGQKFVSLIVAAPTANTRAAWRAALGLGTVATINLNGVATDFLKGDGTWGAAGAGSVAWGSITGTLSAQTDLNAALGARVLKAGDTMTGNLTIVNPSTTSGITMSSVTGQDAYVSLNKMSASNYNVLAGLQGGGIRWNLIMGDNVSDLKINRFNASGVYQNTPLNIVFGTGLMTLDSPSQITLQSGTVIATNFFQTNGPIRTNGGQFQFAAGQSGLLSLSWSASGPYRFNTYMEANSIGDTCIQQAYHQPSVETFWQWTVGSGGSFFRMHNDGWGRSNNGWTTHSDARIKKNLEPLDLPLEVVRSIPVYSFEKTNIAPPAMEGPVRPVRYIGPLAQHVEAVAPEFVSKTSDPNSGIEDLRSLDVSALGTLAWALLPKLLDRIEALEARITQLEA